MLWLRAPSARRLVNGFFDIVHGRALIVGFNSQGNHIKPSMPVEEVSRQIQSVGIS
jgi:hypothetical protein